MVILHDYTDAKEAMIRLLNINPLISTGEANEPIVTKAKNTYPAHWGGSLKAKWRSYHKRCVTENREFNLSFEVFEWLFDNTCYYCGSNKIITIDRKNSKLGYVVGNVVSCCNACNTLKSMMPEGEFIKQVNAIAKHLNK